MVFHLSLMCIAFGSFAFDKTMAVIGLRYRIPNIVLMFLFLLGFEGWIGCVAGMTLCRHKIRKMQFVVCGTLTFFVNIMRQCMN